MQPPPVLNPVLPYEQFIPGGFGCGRMVRIQGTIPVTSTRFAVNLQIGSRGDIALHLNPRFQENKIVRNSVCGGRWGPEESFGSMPLVRGQPFEILILCEHEQFKIAINGCHFADYPHRIPYQIVTHLSIEGQVIINRISFEGLPGSGFPTAPPVHPVPVPHGIPPGPPYPTFSPPPYPQAAGTYPPQPAYGVPQCQPGYPPFPAYPSHPNYPHGSSHKGGLLDKAGAAIGGILGKGHGTGHSAMAGTAVGAGLAGSAIGHLSPKKAKKQKKLAKKALKYGLPVAGVGLGAYALSKGFHHHHHHSSSSSSSSSSSEEE